MKKISYIVLLALLGLHLYLTPQILLKSPSVWHDETLFANVAYNIIHENRVGIDIEGDINPDLIECACWYPPGFFYTLAIWFKIFGFSIENQRILTVLIGGLYIILIYLLIRLFLKEPDKKFSNNFWLWPIVFIGLLADYMFLRSTRIARPEIYVLFFGTAMIYLYLKSIEKRKGILNFILILGSGLLAGWTVLLHPVAIFFPAAVFLHALITRNIRIFTYKNLYLYVLGLLIPVSIWLYSFYPKLDFIKKQMFGATDVKNMGDVWLFMVFQGNYFGGKVIYSIYLIITFIFISLAILYFIRYYKTREELFIQRKNKYLMLGILLVFSWIMSMYGKQFWYSVFPLPFVYIAFVFILIEARNKKLLIPKTLVEYTLVFVQGAFLLLLFYNARQNFYEFRPLLGNNYSYHKLGEKVLKLVPENKTVFLAGGPNLYYVFQERNTNKLITFTGLPGQEKEFYKLLNKVDYIVGAEPFIDPMFGDFLQVYVQKNKQEVTITTPEPLQYTDSVIKLKPVKERVSFDEVFKEQTFRYE